CRDSRIPSCTSFQDCIEINQALLSQKEYQKSLQMTSYIEGAYEARSITRLYRAIAEMGLGNFESAKPILLELFESNTYPCLDLFMGATIGELTQARMTKETAEHYVNGFLDILINSSNNPCELLKSE